ncbi:MAG: glycosyltransferase family 1 protein [Pedobacter sp.]|nr:glycosyltransferase family 1 protein [Pedobacter sp.]MDQ8054204.1 glycosyltransferase family 1 protein [Pedobacter sp.]
MNAEFEKTSNKKESPELDQGFGLSALGAPIRIGYDGKRAANNLTGLGNYSRSLIAHLAAQFPVNQYLVYTPKIKEKIRNFPLFSTKNIQLKLRDKGAGKLLWRSLGIKKQILQDKIDLFHGLSHEIPFGIDQIGIKSIVTMHDLIFLRMPQYYKLIDRIIYKFKSKYACRHADRIIAISERTKQDIVEIYGTDPFKIEVVYQSCDDRFKTLKSDSEKLSIKEKYQLPDCYLLYVGTIEARKNLVALINALPKVGDAIPLVVIGRSTNYRKEVEKAILRNGLEKRVIFMDSVPFYDLPEIYQLASCFILPSYYEGFGIPIIEALYSGIPVIAATGSCLEEAGGPHSLYVPPDDVEALAKAIMLVLTDEQVALNMRKQGLSYVQRFNNELVNAQLMEVYLKTLAQ